jgi:GT2 family glycosyltransferase
MRMSAVLPVYDTVQAPPHKTLAGRQEGSEGSVPLVSAVVVHHSATECLDRCLNLLLSTHYEALEVILVLNGVNPQDRSRVVEQWGDEGGVRIVVLEDNLGYGEGANEAFRHAHGEYIVVLNDDIEVEPGWLTPIINVMEAHPDIGACQPKIRSKVNPGFLDYSGAAGGMLDIFGYPFARGRVFWTVEEDHGQYDNMTDIFWASGAAMVVRRSAWEKVGGFDRIFFLYVEEEDFCWQLHRLGYRVVCVPQSVVHHWGSVSTQRSNVQRIFWNSRNHLILVLKNYSFWQLCFLFPTRLLLEPINALYALFKRQPAWANAILRGLWSVAQSLPSIWRSRRSAATRVGNTMGVPPFYRGSVVFDYFVCRRLTYAELNGADHAVPRSCAQLVLPFAGKYQMQSVVGGSHEKTPLKKG